MRNFRIEAKIMNLLAPLCICDAVFIIFAADDTGL